MKLSFSVPSAKNQSKPKAVNTFDDSSAAQNDNGGTKHLITEFDPSKPAPATAPKTLIPPIQNEWRPHKKMKNLHLPTTDPDSESLQFVSHTAQDESGSDMSYGLNLRADKKPQQNNQDAAAPLRRVPPEVSMLQKFKDDMQRLPDDPGLDEFKDVAVEGFGASLLAGYGWKEGMGIGRNAKEDVKAVQIKRRTAKEGLGFVGDAPAALVRSNIDKDSKNRENKNKEKNEDKEKSEKEKVVRIVGGRDAGLKGSVVSSIGDGYLVLRLSGSGQKVKVKVGDVAELGSREEERCLRKLKDSKIRREEKRQDVGRREERRVVDHRKVSWLTSHIRVRVISRDLKGGRLYLKKGEVLDVVGPTTCDISMDESREIVQGVSQDVLETAIPRCGGPVLVLAGKYKGVYGSLVERDLDRESAVVRDADTHEMFNVKLEQIAEYIGDPSLLGH
ncbi:protein MOS2 [Cajanus cajan]|uniref:Protein MOS2 n=2 Tax=Cajanus cajan TaxID=3821 RepID=A0A151RDK5_CAJCA|nr:protein MOS2 [Cajanus cajan]KYP40708.1 Protein MOS2 [Cajanus cajan]